MSTGQAKFIFYMYVQTTLYLLNEQFITQNASHLKFVGMLVQNLFSANLFQFCKLGIT